MQVYLFTNNLFSAKITRVKFLLFSFYQTFLRTFEKLSRKLPHPRTLDPSSPSCAKWRWLNCQNAATKYKCLLISRYENGNKGIRSEAEGSH